MKINKKIISVVVWIIALSGLIASLAFTSSNQKNIEVKSLNIKIENTDLNSFIDVNDVKLFLTKREEHILNSKIKSVDITKIEKALDVHPAIEKAEVSVDINGDVDIEVIQRTPLVRIFNTDGESYYIDTKSKLMPLNEKYTARVIVATGFINEPFAKRVKVSVNEIINSETYRKLSVLDDIYVLCNYIEKDSVLKNLVHQINMTNENEVEMYLAIGNHKVIFGDAIDIDEKFKKLKQFFIDGLNKTDGWNKYSTINLKYKNQVVCTKKINAL